MPISDVDGYEAGHFGRVYKFIVKPACEKAGFVPIRADEVQRTNHIVIDVLKRIIQADMVICDLSSRNPNVMYELGIRQAFNLPVTLIKDLRTERIFDIQGLRDIEYDENLRIDNTEEAIIQISETLRNTYKPSEGDVNSIIQLLGIKPAAITTTVEVSQESSLLLKAITDLGTRLSSLEDSLKMSSTAPPILTRAIPAQPRRLSGSIDFAEAMVRYAEHMTLTVGSKVIHKEKGTGEVVSTDTTHLTVRFDDGLVETFKFGNPLIKKM